MLFWIDTLCFAYIWAIGTEEQFYLIWPVLLKFTKNKVRTIVFVIFYLTFKFLLYTDFLNLIPFKNLILEFWLSFNIDCMAIGALFLIYYLVSQSY
ncbi:MAG: hypothetical protein CM15mP65_18280 [Crocinitomicaceae bacterium]|nr:MAG: hypothetical protein CM15mP65_18280 [Crocinitomicaceae bacterium]